MDKAPHCDGGGIDYASHADDAGGRAHCEQLDHCKGDAAKRHRAHDDAGGLDRAVSGAGA